MNYSNSDNDLGTVCARGMAWEQGYRYCILLFCRVNTGRRDQCPTSYQWVDLMQWECGDTSRPFGRWWTRWEDLLYLIHSSIDTLSGLLHEVLLYIAYYALWDVGLSYGVFVHRAFWSILMMLCCLQEEVVRCVELPLETTLLDQKWSQLMPVG